MIVPEPMLAEPMPPPAEHHYPPQFSDGRWTWEQKFDGVRCIAQREAGAVRLRSRSGDYPTAQFLPIADALTGGSDVVLDGEIIALHPTIPGHSYQALQRRAIDRVDTMFVAFDCMWQGDRYLVERPWHERRQVLEDVVRPVPLLVTTAVTSPHALQMWEACREFGWEGLIGKPVQSPYRPGRRGPWIKVKPVRRMTATVIGFTHGEGRRINSVGALVLAEPHPQPQRGWRYLGKVGTGFTDKQAHDVARMLEGLRDLCPLDTGERVRARPHLGNRPITWCRPELRVEIAYQELTRDGTPRMPSFQHFEEV